MQLQNLSLTFFLQEICHFLQQIACLPNVQRLWLKTLLFVKTSYLAWNMWTLVNANTKLGIVQGSMVTSIFGRSTQKLQDRVKDRFKHLQNLQWERHNSAWSLEYKVSLLWLLKALSEEESCFPCRCKQYPDTFFPTLHTSNSSCLPKWLML